MKGTRGFVAPASVLQYPRIRPNARPQALPIKSEQPSKEELSKDVHNEAHEEEDRDSLAPATVPWFMDYNKRFENEFPSETRIEVAIPEIPRNAHAILGPLANYLVQDLRLKDLTLIDLRRRENPWGDDTIMLLSTARSERQLRICAESLKGFLRPHGLRPRVDGLINWESTKVKRRRRRKMIGRANYQVEDDSLTWLFVDVGGDSGIILQLFTEKGRAEYQLEELWAKRANNDVIMPETSESRPFTPVLSTRASDGKGPLNRRLFSTSCKKLGSVQ